MRDPIDYVASMYNLHMDRKFREEPNLYTGYLDFVRFLGEWVPRNEDQMTPQYHRFRDSQQRIAANYIISYNNLEEGLRFVSQRLGIGSLVPLAGKTKAMAPSSDPR